MAYGQIITNSVTDQAITPEKLDNALDLTTKTVTLPTINDINVSNNSTVNNLTVNGTVSGNLVNKSTSIAFAIALG